MFVCGVSPARNLNSSWNPPYIAWGHTTFVDPWGEVIATTDEHPNIISCKINLEQQRSARAQIPILKQRKIAHTDLLFMSDSQ
jgi:omega-amidase